MQIITDNIYPGDKWQLGCNEIATYFTYAQGVPFILLPLQGITTAAFFCMTSHRISLEAGMAFANVPSIKLITLWDIHK